MKHKPQVIDAVNAELLKAGRSLGNAQILLRVAGKPSSTEQVVIAPRAPAPGKPVKVAVPADSMPASLSGKPAKKTAKKKPAKKAAKKTAKKPAKKPAKKAKKIAKPKKPVIPADAQKTRRGR